MIKGHIIHLLGNLADSDLICEHLSPKLCKTTPNFKLILINKVTVAANHKFFTLKSNGLKAIAANQGNHVK